MHLPNILTLLPLLDSFATAAPSVELDKRVPRTYSSHFSFPTFSLCVDKLTTLTVIGGFTLSTASSCPPYEPPPFPETVSNVVLIGYGGACGVCTNAGGGIRYSLIQNQFVDPRCTITLFQREDCGDDGVVSGVAGCWMPDVSFPVCWFSWV